MESLTVALARSSVGSRAPSRTVDVVLELSRVVADSVAELHEPRPVALKPPFLERPHAEAQDHRGLVLCDQSRHRHAAESKGRAESEVTLSSSTSSHSPNRSSQKGETLGLRISDPGLVADGDQSTANPIGSAWLSRRPTGLQVDWGGASHLEELTAQNTAGLRRLACRKDDVVMYHPCRQTVRHGGEPMSTPAGERIRFQRERRGWSQEHLAATSGVSLRQIQRIETAESSPQKQTLLALASAFGLHVSELSRGLSTEDLAAIEEQFMCPHCGALLVQRTFVPHEYGDCELEEFECGYTRGWSDRPCPTEPRFPTIDDYDLISVQESYGLWYCSARGKTREARQISLWPASGKTQQEAEARVRASLIRSRGGSAAAEAFLENEIGSPL